MKNAVVFDGRNIYDAKELQRTGFEYFGIGIKNGKQINPTTNNTKANG
jgi:UDPglucose 6-dehydrogenase